MPRRRARHAVQPVAHDDALPPLQHRAVRRARRLRDRRAACASRRARSRWPSCSAASRAPAAIGLEVELASPAETLRAAAAGEPGIALRLRLRAAATAISTRTRPPTRWRAPRATSGAEIRTGERVTGIELGAAARGAGGADRVRPDRDRGRRQRGGHVGAAGRRDGRRVARLDPGRAPAHRAGGRARATSCRATCRASATPTTSSTASPRRAACSSAATSTIRPRAGSTACRGSTAGRRVPADEARFAPLMQGAARRFPFLADAGVVKLVCHPDAMTPDGNPLVGELPGRARLLRRGRPLAQRLRRRGRHRQGDRRAA